jgi:short subunit dehydrogenase-like uncharacterized protein
MPDVLLFGATGFTGRLTAHALAARGADFAIAGRSQARLTAVAETTGNPEIRVASVEDASALADALADVGVLITCVGPFVELGRSAVEAAIKARVHYVDSTGEGLFIQHLLEDFEGPARRAGIALAPALAFDAVPADVAATLASQGLRHPKLTLTYALPAHASLGTLTSALGVAASRGPWLRDGERVMVETGDHHRWAPMPPPLGPKPSISFPFAVGHLAPLHLPLRSLELFATTSGSQRIALKAALPLLRAVSAAPGGRGVEGVARLMRSSHGPDERRRPRSKWTILAEAHSGARWKNVALTGTDSYGLSAGLLASSALEMSKPGFEGAGVLAPVGALGLDFLEKQLTDHGTEISTYGST